MVDFIIVLWSSPQKSWSLLQWIVADVSFVCGCRYQSFIVVLFVSSFSFFCHQGRCEHGCYDWTTARMWHVAVVISAHGHYFPCGTLGCWGLLWCPQPFTFALFQCFVFLSIFA